jgi:hypothetical protein
MSNKLNNGRNAPIGTGHEECRQENADRCQKVYAGTSAGDGVNRNH